MAMEFKVSCPKCGETFSVSTDVCGELAECSECSSVFEIPFPAESDVETAEKKEFESVKGVEADVDKEKYNTVKLSRTGIGMIPKLKDTFEVERKSASLENKKTE